MPFWGTHVLAFEEYLRSLGRDPESMNPMGSLLLDNVWNKRMKRVDGKPYTHTPGYISQFLKHAGKARRYRDIRAIALGMAHHAAVDEVFHNGAFFEDTRELEEPIRRIIGNGGNGRITVHKFLEAVMEWAVRDLDPDVTGRVHERFHNTNFGRVSYHLKKCFPSNGYSKDRLRDSVEAMLGSEDPIREIYGAHGIGYQVLRTVGISSPEQTGAYVSSLSADASDYMRREFGSGLDPLLE